MAAGFWPPLHAGAPSTIYEMACSVLHSAFIDPYTLFSGTRSAKTPRPGLSNGEPGLVLLL
jgi:hypothetical protein